ncbi:unnamed protein product [Moneuplotes crassus]|uniref:Uncharacterized protein n=1 Tax=Euplotes crassus TaxID=5936 RepID=A0AAD1UPY1_EUPCR|nr:unnamed protein product [Moneuplotes crassus]
MKKEKENKKNLSVLDEGGPLSRHARDPFSRVFKKPEFSLAKLKENIKKAQEKISNREEISIRKAPRIDKRNESDLGLAKIAMTSISTPLAKKWPIKKTKNLPSQGQNQSSVFGNF